jgi:serine/threonine-protein kinase
VKKVCPQCRAEYEATLDLCPDDGASLVEAAPAVDPLVGQILADRYKVIRTLGEGGMGRVYLAEHVRMGRLSAVKVMSPALAPTPDAISRFNREAANASRINHPNVAAIYDFGETDDGTLYLAMEFVEGQTLSSLLRSGGPLTPARAAELTGQVADGLTAAHRLGIVHRDLKPDNVLVTHHHDGREWAKVVDFGIAKATAQDSNQTVTSLGMSIGTPEYMSPEQIAGEPLDARTDLYSLGLVLFNMLTGVLPHPALTSKQSLVHRLTARPRTLAEVRPNIAWPPRLQKALERALAPEPDERYSSVADFARDVKGGVGLPTFMGAASIAGSVTRLMTPLVVAAVPGRTPVTPTKPTRTKSGRGPLVAAGLLLAAGAAVMAIRPPTALQAFMQANGLGPRAAAAAHADSVVRAADPAAQHDTAATATTSDSTVAHDAGPLSPVDPGLVLRAAAMRSTADSSDAGHAAVMQSAEAAAREIFGTVTRARGFIHEGQLEGAGKDLRVAFEEYQIFRTEHASAPQMDSIKVNLQAAMDEALSACGMVRDSLAARPGRKIKCQHPAKDGILVVELDDGPARRVPTIMPAAPSSAPASAPASAQSP